MPAASLLSRPPYPPPTGGPAGVDASASSRPPQLAELFTRYAPYVAAIGFKLLGRDDELDDLVQDVFVEAHRGLAQLRTADAAKGWLARITVRRAVRRLRRQKLRGFFSLEAVPDHAALVDGAATPEERAHVAAIYRRLEALPVQERVVWVLRHVEGETLDGIAALCACSKATVQRRLRAAAATLGEGSEHD
jgi:RNA polymerase sigma-70 factor (ECF subfamily)